MHDFIPHGYQKKGTDFVLDNPSAGMFLDCGLGKTVITLTAFNTLKYEMGEVQSLLVVAPLRVALLTWAQEVRKWAHTRHLRVVLLHGPMKDQRLHQRADIYIINYDGLRWLRDELVKPKNGFPQMIDMIVFDESTQVKTPSAERSKIARALAAGIKRKVILTGTPAPNSMLDVWHQIFLLDEGARLGGSYTRFRAEYFDKGEGQSKYFPRRGVTEYISKRIADLCLVMKAEDYLDLPKRVDNTVKVELPEKLKDQYDKFEKEFFLDVGDKGVTAFNAASLGMKLRQFTQGFIYDTEADEIHDIHKEKIAALREIIDGSGSPVLVAINFRYEYEMIRREFGDVPVIYGGTNPKDTIEYVEQWNKGLIPMMVVNPASLSHGANLQYGGHIAVWFSLTWNLEHYLQFTWRLDRQGQEFPVIEHHIIMKDTIDEAVLRALKNKERGMNNLVRQLQEWRDAKLQPPQEDSKREYC